MLRHADIHTLGLFFGSMLNYIQLEKKEKKKTKIKAFFLTMN